MLWVRRNAVYTISIYSTLPVTTPGEKPLYLSQVRLQPQHTLRST
jgi:hypothetical protein